MTDLTLAFGDRSGSWLTVAFFAAIFGGLGWTVARVMVRRTGRPAAARLCALLIFAVPMFMVWITTVNGFYELEQSAGNLRLRYLTGLTKDLPLDAISVLNERPWYKGRWRLEIIDRDGRRYESATSDRGVVDRAVHRLQRRQR